MKEKKRERNPNRQREKEIGIFSMMGFDSGSSSFLALLANKAKTEKGNIKKGSNCAVKMFKINFCLESSVK